MIHQVTSWIRTAYSWVNDDKLKSYFNKCCFRINRSQSTSAVFNHLIVKMVHADNIDPSKIRSNKLLNSINLNC
jgi:hypothetical protein